MKEENMSLPTHADIQAEFDAAQKARVSPCTWIPKPWPDLPVDAKGNKLLASNCVDMGKFSQKVSPEERKKRGKDKDGKLKFDDPETPPNNDQWVNAFADFTHIDAAEFPTGELQAAEALLAGQPQDVLKEVKERMGPVNPLLSTIMPSLKGDSAVLSRLRTIVGPTSPGMQRLARVFDWILYRTTELMEEINIALEKQNEAAYTKVREAYIEFLHDLDNHEPERGKKQLDPRKNDFKKDEFKQFASGYGRAAKWHCIEPQIVLGKIVGVRVVSHWNPHSSSNGIPIPHPPPP